MFLINCIFFYGQNLFHVQPNEMRIWKKWYVMSTAHKYWHVVLLPFETIPVLWYLYSAFGSWEAFLPNLWPMNNTHWSESNLSQCVLGCDSLTPSGSRCLPSNTHAEDTLIHYFTQSNMLKYLHNSILLGPVRIAWF